MKRILLCICLVFVGVGAFIQALGAQAPSAPPQVAEEAAIRAAIAAQVDAWNRADIPTFMQTYENSSDTTFIGAHLNKGYSPILDRTAHGDAKKDDGIFSLVWRKGPQGWKIILDHTS